MLSDGYHAVPRGKVATVVTHLETRARPETRDVPAPEGWRLTRIQTPTVPWYRALYQAVGADWLWFGRMKLPDAEIDAVLSDGDVHVYALQKDGVDGALMELDFRTEGECELVYFGLIPALIGTGAGRFLMNAAIDAAWSAPIDRFHVFTCTLDSPQALAFYRRSGFTPIAQKIEIADDPRITFGYDRSLAPHVPIFDP
ncbi:GNAT family N-acetyltransferase [uncultured Tateyamaria sp.]|uniref:GNAT family N-acetyltransferase n=1 Tax=uncultured Tateyamaria sp. TaxID=455651 RepID=UPI00261AF14A|nr:GNAT family N-acetyltransferase [uncultured Tateyamaria sp.]